MTSDLIQEILDRSRRIETRLTRFISERGGDLVTQMPSWNNGVVDIPSPKCGLSEILAAIPKDWRHEVSVTCRGRYMVTLSEVLL